MSQFIEMFGNPITNTKGWKTMPISEVAPEEPSKERTTGSVWLLNLDMIESNTGKIVGKVYEKDSNLLSVAPFDEGNVLYSKLRPYLNKVVIPNEKGYATTELVPLRPKQELLNLSFFSHLLRSDDFVAYANGIATGTKMPRMPLNDLRKFNCILPPIEVQREFELIAHQADKSGFDELKSQFIEMFKGDFPKLSWEECLTIINGKKYDDDYQESGTYPICGSGGIMGYGERMLCPKDTVILGRKGNINSPIYMETDYWIVDTAFCLDVDRTKLHPKYFYFWCKLFDFTRYNKQGVLPSLTKNDLLKIEMPIPPMELQTKFVDIIEQSDKSGSVLQYMIAC